MIIIMIAERGREINKRPQQDTHTHTAANNRKKKKEEKKKEEEEEKRRCV